MRASGRKLLGDKYGKEMTVVELMEDADRATPEGSTAWWNYAETIAAVATLEGHS